MKKIKLRKIAGHWYIGEEELKKTIDTVNEIVDWINRQPKELWELSPEQIERIGEYIRKCDGIEWPKQKLIDAREDNGRKY